ncbi:uncharacterized protein PG986_008412 [Apiospora aurea]|uniref:Uncharacterized protein n=1 Tax=Apiospora aurea TaxID=335848 RepID=A0ABR1QFB6_9PEZI
MLPQACNCADNVFQPNPIGSGLPSEAGMNTTRLDPRSPTKVRDDIQKLHNMIGQTCTAPAGPSGCARVAYTNGGDVWMCNDNTTPSEAPCSLLGDYAQAIVESCSTKDSANDYVVQGQLFDVGSGPDGSGGWATSWSGLTLVADSSTGGR